VDRLQQPLVAGLEHVTLGPVGLLVGDTLGTLVDRGPGVAIEPTPVVVALDEVLLQLGPQNRVAALDQVMDADRDDQSGDHGDDDPADPAPRDGGHDGEHEYDDGADESKKSHPTRCTR
jgi:hypothetical protein